MPGLGVGKRSKGRVANDHRTDWSKAWALFPGQVAYVWHAGLHCAVVQQSLESQGFAVRAQIIWAKQHFVLSRGDYHWQPTNLANAVSRPIRLEIPPPSIIRCMSRSVPRRL
jgi:hypothetical protein